MHGDVPGHGGVVARGGEKDAVGHGEGVDGAAMAFEHADDVAGLKGLLSPIKYRVAELASPPPPTSMLQQMMVPSREPE